ncbi:solute carrier family 45 member 3 [Gadus chalcogrammus]|uniref:solute carrier family 45 member 3 n=1 Tax=Gadus chalcogrammus TaxID=1042646 RepID=UPI0024C4B2D8|nr:solute carrier family 45 member 3 [Gadus chalcogrammus]XP_056454050.1 solute carrier family 45 member 3 [Gadus chalcogrammus]
MPGWRSRWRLVLLNALTCGLEICLAAGITYAPPMLLEAGVQERYMTMVLGVGPVLGLLFIPLIGSASDQCNSSYGRRRPFLWLLSLGVLLALLIIPHADRLAARLAWGSTNLQVGFLIFGVVLLDFCGQVCFTPLEALLSDLYRDQEDLAFSMFSFMVSLGGCVGYLLPALDWSRGLLSVYLGGQADCLFAILILIFVCSVLVTMKASEEPACAGGGAGAGAGGGAAEGLLEAGGGGPLEAGPRGGPPRSCCYVVKCKLRLLRSLPLLCLLRPCVAMTPALYRSYCHVPAVMRRLCAAQLCSWVAVMSFILFYTDFVGEGLYQGEPSAAPGTAARLRYDEGIRMGSLGLFLQCATSTFFSLVMSRLVRRLGSRWVYLSSMASFTLSAAVICVSNSVLLVTLMSALTGYAYATLQTLPYTLTCHYHKEKELYMAKRNPKSVHTNGVKRDPPNGTAGYAEAGLNGHAYFGPGGSDFYTGPSGQNGSSKGPAGPGGAAPEETEGGGGFEKRGVGLDFAILDSTFLLSQVFPTLFMGLIVQLVQSVTAYMACSVVFGCLAVGLANRIVFEQRDLKT